MSRTAFETRRRRNGSVLFLSLLLLIGIQSAAAFSPFTPGRTTRITQRPAGDACSSAASSSPASAAAGQATGFRSSVGRNQHAGWSHGGPCSAASPSAWSTRLFGQQSTESSSSSSSQPASTAAAAAAAALKQQPLESSSELTTSSGSSSINGNNDTSIEASILQVNQLKVTDESSNNTKDKNNNNKNPLQLWLERNVLLGIEATPETLAIVTIYFVEGALGLARLAQSYLLKDELHLGPAELSALTGLFVLPWTIKPLYGFLSDGFPLLGYKRKSYLIAAGLLGGLSYTALGYGGLWDGTLLPPEAVVPATVAALMVSSACIAFSDVVADGIVVTRTRQSNDPAVAGGLQSLCWGAAAVGGLLSAYFSGSLLEVMSVRSIFGITAVLPFLVALISLGVDVRPVVAVASAGSADDDDSRNSAMDGVKEQVSTLWEALRQPSIWRPALFLFLWQSTPTTDGAFFYFMTNDLNFGPEFLGRVRLVSAGAGLFGVWLYNQYLKGVRIKDILYWSTIASFPLGMLPVLLITHANRELGIPDDMLIYGDDVALAALGQLAFIPTLVLAARLCPPGVEAVLFATLMSINNGAGTVGTEIGALLTKWAGITDSNFDNLAWLTTFCNVSSLWPLLLIGLLDGAGDVSEAEAEAAEREAALHGDSGSAKKTPKNDRRAHSKIVDDP